MLHQNGTLCSTLHTSPTYNLNFLQLYLFNIKKMPFMIQLRYYVFWEDFLILAPTH